MSTAANHRKRSRRGYHMEYSALGNMANRAYIQDAGKRYGASGTSLIYKLRAMHQKILESRKKPVEVSNDG